MGVLIGILRTIILLGAVQGLILCGLLYFSKNARLPGRLLSALLFLMSLACLYLCGVEGNWFGGSLVLTLLSNVVPMIIVMPMGPLIYFYIRAYLEPDFRLTRRRKRHFLPVIIDVVPQLVAAVFIIGVLLRILPNKPGPAGAFIDEYNVYADIPRWLSVTIYLSLSARYLAGRPRITWLRLFVRVFLAFQAIWLVYLVPYVIPRYTDFVLNTFDWYPLYVPLAIIIYWLGIKGYIMAQREAGLPVIPSPPLTRTSQPLSPATVDQAIPLLKKAMEEDKVYLDPALNLQTLATHIGLPAKTVSAVLNQHLDKSFNEYLNEYRVEAFKQKLQDPATEHLTIVGVAFECGFNSQPTFQRVFKELTGKSPTEYRKNNSQIRI